MGEGVEPFRDQIVIATKFGWNIDPVTGERKPGLISRRDHIKQAVEGMLKRLRTDRIDLVYQHRVEPKKGRHGFQTTEQPVVPSA